MGGGPSRQQREAEIEAQNRAREQNAISNRLLMIAETPDPLEERLKAQSLNWLDWSEGKSGPIDVRNAPGLGPSLSLYESASRGQQGERFGIGALRMGTHASDPNLALMLTEQQKARREQEAAGGLERAVTIRDAEMRRSALPLLGLGQNRRMGLAELGSGNANTSQGQYLGFLGRPRQRSFWQEMLLQGMQSGGQVASSKIQFGCVASDTPILTPSGYVPIGELNEGDLAIGVTTTGERVSLPIVRKRVTENSEVLGITNTDGEMERCSPYDRLMFSPDDRSETFVSELSEGTALAQSTLESIEQLPEKETVVIIKLGNQHENFGFLSRGFMHLDDYAVSVAAGGVL